MSSALYLQTQSGSHLMQQHWLPYELKEFWSLSPKGPMEVPRQAIAHLANELGTSIADFDDESFSERLLKFHRADIRAFLGFRVPTNADATMAQQWLTQEARTERSTAHLRERVRQW